MLRPDSFLYETDPKAQNAAWANLVIQRHRISWRPVITTEFYRDKKSKLLSVQNLQATVGKYYTDEEFMRNNPFTPLPIMEKIRNIIIDQAREGGIKPYIKSIDPTAKKHKDQDEFRLQTKQAQISAINQTRAKVGDGVPYTMDDKEFNGNVPEFDKMSLNPQDPSDVKMFFDTYYKLNYEGYAQTAVMAVNADNKVDDDIPRYVNDVMAVKCICKQDFVSPATGQIITKYLQPNQTFAIFGNDRDAGDAPVRGWERQIPLRELMNLLGSAFNFDTQWMQLIVAINYGSNTKFDGFLKGDQSYCLNDLVGTSLNNNIDQPPIREERQFNLLNFDDMFLDTYNYKVYFGYIEWEQPCIHAEKRNRKTGQRFSVDNTFVPTTKSQYEKEEWGYWITKTSNYIATGANSQRLYNYGDMYMQRTKGNTDEFACGSISIIREEGLSAMGISEIYIALANYSYYKMLWAIHRSKPDVWSWQYESIREVAMKMSQNITQGTNTPQVAGGFGDAINKLIDQFDKKLFMLHTHPIVDGQVIGGGGLPHTKIPGALDAIAIQLREIVLDWAENQIGDKLGLQGIAAAQAPNPRDGQKLNELYLRQSRSATGYIPRMIERSFKHTSNLILLYIQDILNFKDTLAYKYLLNLVGDDAIEALESIGNDAAPHRFAIYATSYSLMPEKKDTIAEAQLAFQKGLLSFSEYQLVKGIDEPRVAAKISAYFQEKAQKRIEQQQKTANDFAMQMRDKTAMDKYKLEEMIADKKLEQERIRTNGYIYQADKAYAGKIDSKQIGDANSLTKQEQKSAQEKQLAQDKATIELNKELVKT